MESSGLFEAAHGNSRFHFTGTEPHFHLNYSGIHFQGERWIAARGNYLTIRLLTNITESMLMLDGMIKSVCEFRVSVHCHSESNPEKVIELHQFDTQRNPQGTVQPKMVVPKVETHLRNMKFSRSSNGKNFVLLVKLEAIVEGQVIDLIIWRSRGFEVMHKSLNGLFGDNKSETSGEGTIISAWSGITWPGFMNYFRLPTISHSSAPIAAQNITSPLPLEYSLFHSNTQDYGSKATLNPNVLVDFPNLRYYSYQNINFMSNSGAELGISQDTSAFTLPTKSSNSSWITSTMLDPRKFSSSRNQYQQGSLPSVQAQTRANNAAEVQGKLNSLSALDVGFRFKAWDGHDVGQLPSELLPGTVNSPVCMTRSIPSTLANSFNARTSGASSYDSQKNLKGPINNKALHGQSIHSNATLIGSSILDQNLGVDAEKITMMDVDEGNVITSPNEQLMSYFFDAGQ
jgi:hypothetical protein